MSEYPPTIIVMHPKERRSKCTVAHLRDRDGFVFWKYPNVGPQPFDDYLRLGFGGPILSREDGGRGLLVLDGTWRLTTTMEAQFGGLPVRSLPPLKTAYPRASKVLIDPEGGLATIEAIYAAYRLLGRNCKTLLDGYRWADEFLRLNQEMFW